MDKFTYSFLIKDSSDPLRSLVDFVYPDFFQEQGILSPTLDAVEHVNKFLLSLVLGDEKEHNNFDLVYKSDENSEVQS